MAGRRNAATSPKARWPRSPATQTTDGTTSTAIPEPVATPRPEPGHSSPRTHPPRSTHTRAQLHHARGTSSAAATSGFRAGLLRRVRCDIYAAGGTPCVAAHSTTRALYGSYNGSFVPGTPLLRRGDDEHRPCSARAGVANAARAGLVLWRHDLCDHGHLRPVGPGQQT